MRVKIKKLDKNAVIPFYGTEGSAGMDLTATSKEVVDKGDDYGFIEYGTGLSVEIPEGYAGFIFPRSSISKTGMMLANAVGVIDSDYTGEVKLRFKYISKSVDYKVGDRIGQLIIMPYPKIEFEEVQELSTTARSSGGFGSTGS